MMSVGTRDLKDLRLFQQMANEDPVSPLEFREMVVRHIVANRDDPTSAAVVEEMFRTYLTMNLDVDLIGSEQAQQVMSTYFVLTRGSVDGYSWPMSVPLAPSIQYPRDILVDTALALGVLVIEE